ncbi:MAG: ABC transporter substrate-binding protein [Deltaproteobacteria bacterium]|nr:ABC transporter substrate-binding protein [Deltaproteobacteria bacterium]
MFRLAIVLGALLAAASGAGAAAQESRGPTLVVADATGPPSTLDPYRIYGTQVQSFFRQLYGGLVDRSPDGSLQPGVAERWELVEDHLWRLTLRKGVRFHNGEEVTAEDVRFSLERILAKGGVRRRDFDFIDRVVVVDSHTVDILTRISYPILPARLAQFGVVLPKRLIEAKGEEEFFRAPVGLGPFQFVHMDRQRAVFRAHEQYYQGPPGVSNLIFEFIGSEEERMNRLLQGRVHIVTNLPPRFATRVYKHPRADLVKKPASQFYYILFNTLKDGPLAKRAVRQALRYATNVKSLITYVAQGNGVELATFTMPEEFGYHPDVKPYPFDPGRARALLAGAGYPKGFRLRVVATYEVEVLMRAVARQWEKVGVRLEIEVDHRTQAINRWIAHRDLDAYALDPTNLLFDAIYHLKSKLDPEHPISRFRHPEASRLLPVAEQAMSEERRRDALRRLQAIVHEEVPAIAFYQAVNLYGVRPEVANFTPHADTILRLHGVTLRGKARR